MGSGPSAQILGFEQQVFYQAISPALFHVCLFGWLIEFSFFFSFGSAHNWPQDGTRAEQALYHSAVFPAWSGYISNKGEN